jgi:hypothetical protein
MHPQLIIKDDKRATAFNCSLVEACLKRGAYINTAFFMDEYRVFEIVINPNASGHPYMFVAGIHGNEVAGPLSALQFIEKSVVSPDKQVVIIPMVNPYGFDHNQRECKSGEDINRLFNDAPDHEVVKSLSTAVAIQSPRFIHSLHEDPDREEFYLYYSDLGRKDLYSAFIETIASNYLDVVEDDEEGGHKIRKGLCRPTMPHDQGYDPSEDRTFENHMLEQFYINHLLTETPMKAKLEHRITVGRMAMEYVLATH